MAKEKQNIEIKGNISKSVVGDNNNVTINKNHKNKAWTIIGIVLAIIGIIVSVFFGMEQNQKNENEIINTLKKDAIQAFEKKEFNSAFNLFCELREKLPNDSCGHYFFLNKAKEMLKYGEYDDRICDLLEKAYKLHSTKEANDLLKICK